MDAGSQLLAAYMEYAVKHLGAGWGAGGFSPRTHACMVLDKVAGDLMDNAAVQQRRELYAAYDAVKQMVLRAGSNDEPLVTRLDSN